MKIGLDIGGTKCAVVLGDEKSIIKKVKFATKSCEETIQEFISIIEEMGDEFDGIGISCGGPLDSKTGVIMSPPNLPGWDNIHITDIMTERFGVPAYLCNDANACALAEWKYGAGKGTENMVFLTFGTGLGAGLILNGRLYNGTNGMAGEVGHIRLDSYGPVGYGKIGSFEGFCSGRGIAQIGRMLAMEKLQMGQTLPYCKSAADLEGINAKVLADYADAGEPVALEAYTRCGEMLGRGVAVIVDMLNPQAVVIGSIFQRSENLLREPMEKYLKKEALGLSNQVCKVLPAALGDSIGDYAALSVAYEGEKAI